MTNIGTIGRGIQIKALVHEHDISGYSVGVSDSTITFDLPPVTLTVGSSLWLIEDSVDSYTSYFGSCFTNDQYVTLNSRF